MGDDAISGTVGELWLRIVAWLEENAPVSADALVRTGATDTDLARAEASTSVEWTDELRSWFTVQGGAGHLGILQVHGLLEPLSLQEAMAARDVHLGIWRHLVEDDPTLREEPQRAGTAGLGFQPEFVPIADDPGGSVLVVDLRPGARRGCVGTLLDGDGVTFRELGWPSIAAWLEDVEVALSQGSPSSHGIPAVEDGRLVWRLLEPAYDEVDLVYGGGYLEVLDVNDPRVPPLDEQRTAAFLARLGAWPDGPPPGWYGPWPPLPPEMTGEGSSAHGDPGVLVASLGSGWWTEFGGGRPAPTTRLHLTYRRDADPRAAIVPVQPLAADPPVQVKRSPRRAEPAPSLESVWAAVVAWLEENAPATARQVAGSIGDAAEVAAAEAAAGMDVPWPDDLRWWFTVAPHLVENEEGDHLFGPYRAMSAAEAVGDIEMWREISSAYPEELEYAAGTAAGEPVGSFCPQFVPIAVEGGGVELVVDLRPGADHGCVLIYSAEEGTRSGAVEGDEDDGWPSLAAMVLDLLCALADGDHFEWTSAVVSEEGAVLWELDDDEIPAPAARSWSWGQARDRVAAAWEARDDEAVWAALVDALLEYRALSPDEATRSSWDEPAPIGDPVIDALITGAARHCQHVLGRNGSTWQWRGELDDEVPVEAGVDAADEMRLHDATPTGFLSVGLLLDPSRLPY